MKTFLAIVTSAYTGSKPMANIIETDNLNTLLDWGWSPDEEYNILNTEYPVKIEEMEIGDCIESDEYNGKLATLYRIG